MDFGALGVTLGMKGISELTSGSDMFSEAVSGEGFGDILAKASTNVSDEVKADDNNFDAAEEEEISFSELAEELSSKIDEAGPEVVSAAVELVKSVGKAVEKLFGGELFASDNEDDETESITDVFAMLFNLIPEENAENESLSGLFASISDLIDAGMSEEMDTTDIVDQLLEALKPKDDDDESLADAVMMLLCSLSGVNYSADDFDSALITNDAVSKLGNIADIISDSSDPANTVQNLSELLTGAEEDSIDFISFLHKQSGVSFSDSIVKAANSLKVNDASDQLSDAAGAMALLENIPEATDSEVSVFKELGEFVNTQLTERIVSEIVSKSAFDVKELTVVLRPESLGEIAVKIAADENGMLSIVMAASNSEVGKAISENAAALSESLAKQNIRVEDVNVVNPSEASSYMGLDFTNQSFNRKNDDGGNSESGSRRNSVEAIGSDIDAADAARAEKLLKEARLWATA